jgi:hypothetical protein
MVKQQRQNSFFECTKCLKKIYYFLSWEFISLQIDSLLAFFFYTCFRKNAFTVCGISQLECWSKVVFWCIRIHIKVYGLFYIKRKKGNNSIFDWDIHFLKMLLRMIQIWFKLYFHMWKSSLWLHRNIEDW